MSKAVAWVKAVWDSLPHKVQAGLVIFGTAVLTTLGKELEAVLTGQSAFTVATLKHDLVAAIIAGAIAAKTFYMTPNLGATDVQSGK